MNNKNTQDKQVEEQSLEDKISQILLEFDEWKLPPTIRKLNDLIHSEKLALLEDVDASLQYEVMADKNHICRFNDGEQNCECFLEGFNKAMKMHRQKLAAIRKGLK